MNRKRDIGSPYQIVVIIRCCKHDSMFCYWFQDRPLQLAVNGVSEQNHGRLQRVQNKGAHIVCNASRHAPSTDLLHFLHGYLFADKLNSRQLHCVSKQ